MGNTNQRYSVYEEDEIRNELIHEDEPSRTVTFICDCFSSRKDNPTLSLHRALNLRAGMSTNRIKDLKQELRQMNFAANDIDQSADIESYEQSNEMEMEMEQKQQSLSEEDEYIKHQIESIECTKQELENELKILESRTNSNKMVEFGNSMAIDILQESLDAEEAKQRQLIYEINKSI